VLKALAAPVLPRQGGEMSAAPIAPPRTIADVLSALRTVVDDAAGTGDRTGLFAAVYRQVTAAVARGVRDGLFDDADRINRFDAVFAGRYLAALDARRTGRDPGRSWRLAFRAAEDPDLVLVQHLVLGINAHINLDLAVAAAQTSPGAEIAGLREDFERINDVLLDVLCDLQGALNGLSPLLGGLDVVLGRLDEEIFGFKLQRAREEAWEAAVLLAGQSPEDREKTVRMLDRYAYGLGRVVLAPPFPVPAALQVVRFAERTGTSEAITQLDGALGL
jgi:hypothetical protein